MNTFNSFSLAGRASARLVHILRLSLPAALVVLAAPAWAGGVVANPTESALRAAMAGGGVVTFDCDGTIVLADTITNTQDVVLDATGRHITISGGNAVRVFVVQTNVSFTVVNVAIDNGASSNGAGIFNSGGSVYLQGVSLLTNTATCGDAGGTVVPGEGGAVFNRGGMLNATNCAFTGNLAQALGLGNWTNIPSRGGAIRNESGQVDLRNCVFTGNRVLGARGTGYRGNGLPGYAGQDALGGAIDNSGALQVDRCTFVENSASGGRGGTGDQAFLFVNVGPPGGLGGAAGGGAICNRSNLWVARSTFWSNSAAGGVGGMGGQGAGVVSSSGGTGGPGNLGGVGNGGAILNVGSANLDASTLAWNAGTGGEGGAGGFGGPALSDVVVPGTGGVGGVGGAGYGGICSLAGQLNLVNCTLAWNIGVGGSGGWGGEGGWPVLPKYPAGNGGGGGSGGSGLGGCFGGGGTVSLTNGSLAFNSGTGGNGGPGGGGRIFGPAGANGSGGGGVQLNDGRLVNTLLATNTPGGNCVGHVADMGHNLSSDGTCGFTKAGSLNDTDAKLGALANNGGLTLTLALLPGSPAIDGGDNAAAPPTDQRGFPRPVGANADIGAYEESGPAVLRIVHCESGGMDVVVYGCIGQNCRLFLSTTLNEWVPVATNQISTNGSVVFHDNCEGAGAQRFYRVDLP